MTTVIVFIAIAVAVAVGSVFALDKWLGNFFDRRIDEMTGEAE